MPISATPRPSGSSGNAPAVTNGKALAVVTTIFFMWGFLTCLNDILIPHLKAVFELNYAKAMLVQFTFFGTYFLMSLPAGPAGGGAGLQEGHRGRPGDRRHRRAGLLAGGRAARVWRLPRRTVRAGHRHYRAAGGRQPYVALLGPEQTSSSRLTLAQALNSLGTAIAPIFGGMLILSNTVKSADDIAALPAAEQLAYRAAEAQAVQGPYVGLAVALVLLALFVFLFRLPALSDATEQADQGHHHSYLDALRKRHLLLGVLGIFFYVGAEVSIGSFLVNYLSMPNIGGFSEQEATHYVSAYWTMAMIGRFAGSALLARFSPSRLLAIFALVNVALLVTTMLSSGNVALYSVVAIGLFNSIMFPTIFALSIERLGPLTNKGSSLLIMAIVGGAVVPYLQGVLADHIGVQASFILPLLCYGYIIFYGLVGARTPASATQGG
jgi:FHS family L-fucose permease-like MFS transporter